MTDMWQHTYVEQPSIGHRLWEWCKRVTGWCPAASPSFLFLELIRLRHQEYLNAIEHQHRKDAKCVPSSEYCRPCHNMMNCRDSEYHKEAV